MWEVSTLGRPKAVQSSPLQNRPCQTDLPLDIRHERLILALSDKQFQPLPPRNKVWMLALKQGGW
jgi:hypothetical protein